MKWEYRVIAWSADDAIGVPRLCFADRLNEAGAEGWEVFAVVNGGHGVIAAYARRPVPEVAIPPQLEASLTDMMTGRLMPMSAVDAEMAMSRKPAGEGILAGALSWLLTHYERGTQPKEPVIERIRCVLKERGGALAHEINDFRRWYPAGKEPRG